MSATDAILAPDCPAHGGSVHRLVRFRLLDLFCCEGGAGMGYHRAGFDITGVDIEPRSRNPLPAKTPIESAFLPQAP